MSNPLDMDAYIDKMKWDYCIKPALWWGSAAVILAAGIGFYVGRRK